MSYASVRTGGWFFSGPYDVRYLTLDVQSGELAGDYLSEYPHPVDTEYGLSVNISNTLMVAWGDLRGGTPDIYGRRYTASDLGLAPRPTSYYYHGGQRVAQRTLEGVFYLHADHLGSTSLTTDAGGSVIARQLYHPYGTVRYAEGELPTDFTFTGQKAVPGTGLIFMHARFYHAALGRWASADTIVPNPINPQLFNRYSYAGNSPILYDDPDGHCGLLCLGLGLVAVVGAAVLTVDMVNNCHAGPGHCVNTGVGAVMGDLSFERNEALDRPLAMEMGRYVGYPEDFEIIMPAAILKQGYHPFFEERIFGNWSELAAAAIVGLEGRSWGPALITPKEARMAGGKGEWELFQMDASIRYMAYKLREVNIQIDQYPDTTPLERFMLLSIGQNNRLGSSDLNVKEYFSKFKGKTGWKGYLAKYPGYAHQLWGMLARYEWLIRWEGWTLPPGVSLDEYRRVLEEATRE